MHRNLKTNFLAICIILVGLTATMAYGEYVCGDANGDGFLNVSDAVFIINHVFVGGAAPDPNCCADCPPTVTDYDGNVYETVAIGGQCWMKQNLKVTHYRNGNPIQLVTDNGAWAALSSGAQCSYDNNEGYVATYGRLYNWYAVSDPRGLAPEGWHVASDAEWKEMEIYLGMSASEADGTGYRGTIEGGKLKEAGTTHWINPNTGATNESGFTALPAGLREYYATFGYLGQNAAFWTSSVYSTGNAWLRALANNESAIMRMYYNEQTGLSVRCIKNY